MIFYTLIWCYFKFFYKTKFKIRQLTWFPMTFLSFKHTVIYVFYLIFLIVHPLKSPNSPKTKVNAIWRIFVIAFEKFKHNGDYSTLPSIYNMIWLSWSWKFVISMVNANLNT